MSSKIFNPRIEALEARIAPAGLVTVTFVAGALVLDGDDADNNVVVFQTDPTHFRVLGNATDINTAGVGAADFSGQIKTLQFTGGIGADTLSVVNQKNLKSLTFTGGEGADRFVGHNIKVNGPVSLDLGAGDDQATFGGLATSISGTLTVDYGADGGSVDVRSLTSQFSGVVLNGGAGNDSFTLLGNTVKISKSLKFSAGDGDNALNLLSVSASIASTNGRSIDFTGGSGLDSIFSSVGTLSLKGAIVFAGGAGSDHLNLQGHKAALGKSGATGQSIMFDSGEGDDRLDVGARVFSTKGSVEMIASGGTNIVDIDALSIVIGQSKAKRSVLLQSAASDTGSTLTVLGTSLKLLGSVEQLGSGGDDKLFIGSSKLNALGSISLLSGGTGIDSARIEAMGTIKGKVEFDLGDAPAGLQSAIIRGSFDTDAEGFNGGLKIGGTVSILSAATSTNTNEGDQVILGNVLVSGAIGLSLGDGLSLVTIDNLTALKTVSIATAAGLDTVNFERASLSGPSSVKGLVTINLGADDDILQIGNNSPLSNALNNRVSFLGGLTADGGDGAADTINDVAALNSFKPGVVPTLTGFEIVN